MRGLVPRGILGLSSRSTLPVTGFSLQEGCSSACTAPALPAPAPPASAPGHGPTDSASLPLSRRKQDTQGCPGEMLGNGPCAATRRTRNSDPFSFSMASGRRTTLVQKTSERSSSICCCWETMQTAGSSLHFASRAVSYQLWRIITMQHAHKTSPVKLCCWSQERRAGAAVSFQLHIHPGGLQSCSRSAPAPVISRSVNVHC